MQGKRYRDDTDVGDGSIDLVVVEGGERSNKMYMLNDLGNT